MYLVPIEIQQLSSKTDIVHLWVSTINKISTKQRLFYLAFATCFQQWALVYRTLESQTHWNTESFEVWISNGSILEWLVIALAMVVPTI